MFALSEKTARFFGKSKDRDMTEGGIVGHLIAFMLPLLLGNIFQQLYNMVDTWVVGNFVSNEAFSAVGTLMPVINMLIGTFIGFSSGAGVVISQLYGAGDREKVNDASHTAIVATAFLTVVLSVLGIVLTPLLLGLMKVPAEVYPEARDYLTIYFSGLIGLLFYNMGAGIMRAIGDSRRPFYYLVVCAVLNTVLDLVFVIEFHWGVKGVAYATILSQFISAILTVASLFRTSSSVKLSFRKMKCHWAILKKIIIIGLPAALQMAITSFSNVFVQSYINQFGANCMGGWTAYLKLDMLIMLPMQSLALTTSTFVGQNIGKGQVDRAKKGVYTAVGVALGITAVIAAILMIFAPSLIAFFNRKPEVVEIGTMFLRWLSPFYLICCFNQIFNSALRGAGHSLATMIIMLSSFVAFRQVYLFIMSRFISNTMLPIGMAYPAGWFVCSVVTLIYFHHADFTKHRLTVQYE